ncbi:metallothionein-2 [Nothobranchius furzeri]|uniref:metallothionein-2 n=1 Tax=Nothobranchius furzeri TaxID=105023 RepID=UPI003904C9C3
MMLHCRWCSCRASSCKYSSCRSSSCRASSYRASSCHVLCLFVPQPLQFPLQVLLLCFIVPSCVLCLHLIYVSLCVPLVFSSYPVAASHPSAVFIVSAVHFISLFSRFCPTGLCRFACVRAHCRSCSCRSCSCRASSCRSCSCRSCSCRSCSCRSCSCRVSSCKCSSCRTSDCRSSSCRASSCRSNSCRSSKRVFLNVKAPGLARRCLVRLGALLTRALSFLGQSKRLNGTDLHHMTAASTAVT